MFDLNLAWEGTLKTSSRDLLKCVGVVEGGVGDVTCQRTWLELGTHVQVSGKAIQMIVQKLYVEGPLRTTTECLGPCQRSAVFNLNLTSSFLKSHRNRNPQSEISHLRHLQKGPSRPIEVHRSRSRRTDVPETVSTVAILELQTQAGVC